MVIKNVYIIKNFKRNFEFYEMRKVRIFYGDNIFRSFIT